MLALETLRPWQLLTHVGSAGFWYEYLRQLKESEADVGLHVAVLLEPFLSFVLDGRKTVESRFSARRHAPYQAVHQGDVILLKRSAGPIVGIAIARRTWFYWVTPMALAEIKESFAESLCARDEAFWDARRDASYATLIELGEVMALPPIPCDKRDQRGWVTLRGRQLSFRFA